MVIITEDENPNIANPASFLIKSSSSDKGFDLLLQSISQGCSGFCITRAHPEDVRKRYHVTMPMIWLAEGTFSHPDVQVTADIGEIRQSIHTFLEGHPNPAILLDRVDYLIMRRDFKQVMELLYGLNDAARQSGGTIILSVDPAALTSQQLAVLEQELQEIPRSKRHLPVELQDDLHEIMAFASANERVTFKDVCRKFKVTKATTRKRVARLAEYGYAIVSKNGRSKIIKLTKEGIDAL
ncbi:TPA: DUF835 domain-containing protein [Candidatus Woesearchaeota archaeon]|nr:DUF835 domain-containing protein [Candidatus Woesearchaeota archaeon]HII69061.1 DUF835 domain-containing protein [Candidatus Woesearchaeota archaeon]